MAIFFGSLPISLITFKVTFFLGFDALYLYLKFNSFAIFAILFIVGKLKDKGALLVEDDEFDKIQPLIETELEKSSS